MNKSIKPSVFNDNWLAVKVNDDYWFNVKLKIKVVKGKLEIKDCLFKDEPNMWEQGDQLNLAYNSINSSK